ncbi:hypothetical protein C8Q74DRAFT_364679 [Fomes fomentarius]|nr:hypothetical protein C8Q74DRAFT_364679 [Fomes fomentarius]
MLFLVMSGVHTYRLAACGGSPSTYHGLNPIAAEKALTDMIQHKYDLEQRILETARFINAGRPFNRLPVEIMVKVFCLVHQGSPTYGYTTHHRVPSPIARNTPWYPMLAVCHHWRAVVTATPMLWCIIHAVSDASVEDLKTILSRSGNQPIEVILDNLKDVDLFTDALDTHLPRISTLLIRDTVRDEARAVSRLVHKTFPTLRRLRVWFDPQSEHQGRELFLLKSKVERLPQLLELSLRGVGLQGPLDCGSSIQPSLSRLELRDSTSPGCHIHDLMWVLQQCSSLESLTLARFRPFDPDFHVLADLTTINPLPVVEFTPKLRQLVVEDLDVYTARLLSAFSVPVSTNVTVVKLISPNDVGEVWYSNLVDESFESCLPPDRSRLPILDHLVRARITQSGSSIYAVAHSGESTFSIGVKSLTTLPISHDLLFGVASFLGQSPVVELCIDGIRNLRHPGFEDWCTALEQVSQLKKLAVFLDTRPSMDMLGGLWDALSAEVEDDDTPICPDLEELSLNALEVDGGDVSTLRDALLARAGDKSSKQLKSLYVELKTYITPSRSPEGLKALEDATRIALQPCADVVQCSHRQCPRVRQDEIMDLLFLMYPRNRMTVLSQPQAFV